MCLAGGKVTSFTLECLSFGTESPMSQETLSTGQTKTVGHSRLWDSGFLPLQWSRISCFVLELVVND